MVSGNALDYAAIKAGPVMVRESLRSVAMP